MIQPRIITAHPMTVQGLTPHAVTAMMGTITDTTMPLGQVKNSGEDIDNNWHSSDSDSVCPSKVTIVIKLYMERVSPTHRVIKVSGTFN